MSHYQQAQTITPPPAAEAALIQRIRESEDQTLELKIKPPRPPELAERICGMANRREGGLIIFGVEDATKNLRGIAQPADALDLIHKSLRLLKPPLGAAQPDPATWRIQGVLLILLEIPPNQGALYQAGGTFWLRKGSMTVPMSADEIAAHLSAYGLLPWETVPCLRATPPDLDLGAVEQYMRLRTADNPRRLRFTTPEEWLQKLQCIAPDPAGILHPTNLGLLLFGREPQLYLPYTEITCAYYTDILGAGRWQDRKILRGTITDLIDDTEAFLLRHISVEGTIEGFKRADHPEYPLAALREAVVNAVVHRDYRIDNEAIRILLYPDRIEIHSPGLLVQGITLADLIALRAPSKPRNPLLAGFLRDIPGYMERIGSGIKLIVSEMNEHDLPAPEFREQGEFQVILRKYAAPLPTINWPLDQFHLAGLKLRQLKALEIIQQKNSINGPEYAAAVAIPLRTANRDLQDMETLGILVGKGRTKALRYYLA